MKAPSPASALSGCVCSAAFRQAFRISALSEVGWMPKTVQGSTLVAILEYGSASSFPNVTDPRLEGRLTWPEEGLTTSQAVVKFWELPEFWRARARRAGKCEDAAVRSW